MQPLVRQTRSGFQLRVPNAGEIIVLEFPYNELSNGASLARLMTLKSREIIASDEFTGDAEAFKKSCKSALPYLRDYVESYFELIAPIPSESFTGS